MGFESSELFDDTAVVEDPTSDAEDTVAIEEEAENEDVVTFAGIPCRWYTLIRRLLYLTNWIYMMSQSRRIATSWRTTTPPQHPPLSCPHPHPNFTPPLQSRNQNQEQEQENRWETEALEKIRKDEENLIFSCQSMYSHICDRFADMKQKFKVQWCTLTDAEIF